MCSVTSPGAADQQLWFRVLNRVECTDEQNLSCNTLFSVKMMIHACLQSLNAVLFFGVIVIYSPTVGNHQGWLTQAACPCKPTGPLARTILKLYKGLFIKPQDVFELPVIKPIGGRNEQGNEGNLTSYVGNLVTNINKQPSCCNT